MQSQKTFAKDVFGKDVLQGGLLPGVVFLPALVPWVANMWVQPAAGVAKKFSLLHAQRAIDCAQF